MGKVQGLENHIRLYRNGRDLANRPRDVMVIDLFGLSAEQVRDRFPAVYQHLVEHVKVEREAKLGGSKDLAEYARLWWIFGKPRTDFRPALAGLPRYIATIETAKHRFFQFLDASILPDNMLVNIAVDHPAVLAVLSSRIEVAWMLGTGGTLEDRPRYNKTKTFDPYPFPDFTDLPTALTDQLTSLGTRLDAFRKDRIAAHPHLTMTGLYNALERLRDLSSGADVPGFTEAERDPYNAGQIQILRELHDNIDRAVLNAYGWPDLIAALVGKPGATTPSPHKTPAQEAAEEDLLARLVTLNQTRAAEEAKGKIRWLRPEYQIPKLKAKAPRPEDGEQIAADVSQPAAEDATAWPTDGLDQIRLVRDILTRAATPLSPAEISHHFKGGRKRDDRISTVLRHMVETGMVRAEAKAYFVPR